MEPLTTKLPHVFHTAGYGCVGNFQELFENIPDFAQKIKVLGLLTSEVRQAEKDIQTMTTHCESKHFSDDSDKLNFELPEFDIHFLSCVTCILCTHRWHICRTSSVADPQILQIQNRYQHNFICLPCLCTSYPFVA